MANYVLEILDGDRAGEVLPVGDATVRIGRKAGNDIVLADEKTSGVHCEIQPEGDRLVLKDLGSTNGTFLDGRRLTELVLTPGDIVTVGRTRVRFRAEGEAAEDVDAGEFAMRKLDAGRAKRGSSVGVLLLLLVVAGGGGGWYWWQGQQKANGDSPGQVTQAPPLVVTGNRVKDEVANCEAEEGWNLRVAGIGFRSGGQANTGTSGFSAYFDSAEDENGAAAAKSDDDFAVMQLAEPIDVFAGRTMTVAAHGRTMGGAQMALHATLFSSNEDVPFRFTSGTKMAAYDDGWNRLETTVTVPSGCDRLLVEIVCVVPNKDSEAMVDDVAVTEGGNANGVEVALAEAGQTAFGVGSSLAIRSADVQNPATVLRIVPDQVPAALAGLHKAGYCVLSDVGATVACTKEGSTLNFAATGVESLQFVMPAEAAGGLWVLTDDVFAPGAAESTFETDKLLFGSHTTRAMLTFEATTKVVGKAGKGLYRLSCAANNAAFVLGFRAQRQEAGQLVRDASSAKSQGRPGEALDLLAKLFATVPMDSEELGKAQKLRGEILSEQASQVAQLGKDFEAAKAFNTRGGFERVASGVSELVALYGDHNMEDLASAQELRGNANQQLVAFDRSTHKVQRERLTMLADAFGNDKPALRKIVQDYIIKHLPQTIPDENGENTGGGEEGGKD